MDVESIALLMILLAPDVSFVTLQCDGIKDAFLEHPQKMKNRRKQNFEGEANNMQLNKEDTRRSN